MELSAGGIFHGDNFQGEGNFKGVISRGNFTLEEFV